MQGGHILAKDDHADDHDEKNGQKMKRAGKAAGQKGAGMGGDQVITAVDHLIHMSAKKFHGGASLHGEERIQAVAQTLGLSGKGLLPQLIINGEITE